MCNLEERIRLLRDLIRCALPVAVTAEALSRLPWDTEEPLVVLTPSRCVAVLDRFLRGELSPGQVEEWADALEVRDDIELESEIVEETVHCLANPVLVGPLTAAAAVELRSRCAETA